MDNPQQRSERPSLDIITWIKAGVVVLEQNRSVQPQGITTAIGWWQEGLDIHDKSCRCGITLQALAALEVCRLSQVIFNLLSDEYSCGRAIERGGMNGTTANHA